MTFPFCFSCPSRLLLKYSKTSVSRGPDPLPHAVRTSCPTRSGPPASRRPDLLPHAVRTSCITRSRPPAPRGPDRVRKGLRVFLSWMVWKILFCCFIVIYRLHPLEYGRIFSPDAILNVVHQERLASSMWLSSFRGFTLIRFGCFPLLLG